MNRINRKNTVKISELLIVLYLFNIIVIPNGTVISKVFKLTFALLAFFFLTLRNKLRWGPLFTWQTMFYLLAAASFFWAASKPYAIDGIKTMGINFICVFLFSQIIENRFDLQNFAMKCFAFIPLLILVRLLIDYQFTILSGLRDIATEEHNLIGMYSGLGVVWCLYFYIQSKKKDIKWIAFGIINIFIVIISMSRKSILYMLMPLLFTYLLSGSNRIRKIRRSLIIAAIVLAVLFLIFNVPVLYKYIGEGIESLLSFFISGAGDASAEGRQARVLFGIRMFRQKPILGWGIKSFNYFFSIGRDTNQLVADNNFVDVAANLGVIGLIVYYSIYFVITKEYVKKKDNYNLIYSIPMSILITMLIADYGVSSYIYIHCQTIIALICCVLVRKK